MRRFACILTTTAIGLGAPWITQTADAEENRAQPLRSAIQAYATEHTVLLERTERRLQIRRWPCRAKVGAGAAIGAGFGAVSGAFAVGSNGNRGAGAAYGAIIFSIVGAGFGYKACGP